METQMKTFKMYFRYEYQITSAFVDARGAMEARIKLLARFPGASVQTIVEL